jgi:hypothetical protein
MIKRLSRRFFCCTHLSGYQHQQQLTAERLGEASAFSFLHRAFILLLLRLA